jgi:ferric-dicitrate binding protein FerR (iron transport regulator)
MNFTHDAIHEEAAAWFAKRRNGACSEDASFEAWRARSKEHAHAYAEIERAWGQWKQLQHSARMRQMTAAAMKATAPGRRQATGRRWRLLLLAASLAAIAVFGAIRLLPLVTAAPLVAYSTSLG